MNDLTDAAAKEFLETTPLYQWIEFSRPIAERGSLQIAAIDDLCDTCGQIRPFHNIVPRGSRAPAPSAAKGRLPGMMTLMFQCVTCNKDSRIYYVHQVANDNTIMVQKIGQYPRQRVERSKALRKFFKADAEYYEKAAVCLSTGYGIAAFAYLRRIVESNIGKLLDLLEEDANSTNDEPNDILVAIEALRKDSPMSERIKVANQALPSYLNPGGINPLGKLYKSLSEGVHALSDQECLERANAIQSCLEYLISELSSRKKHREKFKRITGNI